MSLESKLAKVLIMGENRVGGCGCVGQEITIDSAMKHPARILPTPHQSDRIIEESLGIPPENRNDARKRIAMR